MSTIQDILDAKGSQVWTTAPEDMVLDAISEMARRDVGALVVVEESGPVGMFTERHYARDVFLKGRSSPETPVRDAMRAGLVYVGPERTVEECMAIMTDQKVRHLPVMDSGKLIGIISLGDLVKSIIADREFMIEQLANYISDSR